MWTIDNQVVLKCLTRFRIVKLILSTTDVIWAKSYGQSLMRSVVSRELMRDVFFSHGLENYRTGPPEAFCVIRVYFSVVHQL